jgi:hypothetical protein
VGLVEENHVYSIHEAGALRDGLLAKVDSVDAILSSGNLGKVLAAA